MEAIDVAQVFVLHVKVGYEDRRRSIEGQLQARGMAFEFMLEGDIPDLTAEDRARFGGWLLLDEPAARSQMSCALKHLRVYEELVGRRLPDALVLEDDIELAPDFVPVFNRVVRESRHLVQSDPRLVIPLENSMLHFVPGHQRQEGRLLYPADHARCTGAYYITQQAAANILKVASREKVEMPIDNYHTHLCRRGELPIMWCQPPIAEQGSMNGKFLSAINPGRGAGLTRRVSWELDKRYKQLVSRFRYLFSSAQ